MKEWRRFVEAASPECVLLGESEVAGAAKAHGGLGLKLTEGHLFTKQGMKRLRLRDACRCVSEMVLGLFLFKLVLCAAVAISQHYLFIRFFRIADKAQVYTQHAYMRPLRYSFSLVSTSLYQVQGHFPGGV